ncbi:MAG: VOC family protein [Bryobacterales bacterium]|nr:VOC family protein [Bryobacterales bacterium]
MRLPLLVFLAAISAVAEPAPDVPWRNTLLIQLQVADLDRSVRFYTDTLGFKLTERRDDLGFVHLEAGIGGLEIGLSKASAERPPVAGSTVLNFGVKGDIEKARKILESRGVKFLGPTQVIPGKVKLASFRDPDGHLLRLAGSAVPEDE